MVHAGTIMPATNTGGGIISTIFTRLNTPTLKQNCTQAIMSKIISGELKPGDRLPPERELAEMMGISRSSVNQSVLELETRRLTRSGGAVIITQRINTQISDMALRMKRSGLKVRLYWISDSQRPEALAMLMRLSGMGVYVKRVSPLCDWKERNLAS